MILRILLFETRPGELLLSFPDTLKHRSFYSKSSSSPIAKNQSSMLPERRENQ